MPKIGRANPGVSTVSGVRNELSTGLTVERIDGTPVSGLSMREIKIMLERRPVVVVFGCALGREEREEADAPPTSSYLSELEKYERHVVGARSRIRQACESGLVSVEQYDLVRNDEKFLFELDRSLETDRKVVVTFSEPASTAPSRSLGATAPSQTNHALSSARNRLRIARPFSQV